MKLILAILLLIGFVVAKDQMLELIFADEQWRGWLAIAGVLCGFATVAFALAGLLFGVG